MLPKRLKFLISSILCALCMFLFLSLPYESRYYGLLVGIVLVIFCFWFGLGIIFEQSFLTRVMSVLLPVGLFVGFGLFAALLPSSILGILLSSAFFGMVAYGIFLVENVFLVAIGYKTVPLYRAAYTVSLILLLLTAFFLFDSMYTFKFPYWGNMIGAFLVSVLVFMYQFWAVAIELPDDGKNKNLTAYVVVPSLIMAQLALVFSFWPVGIFKGSIYLVSIIYLLAGLLEADIRERLFKQHWRTSIWVGMGIILGIVFMTSWN